MGAVSELLGIFEGNGLSADASRDLVGVLQSESTASLKTGSQNNGGTDRGGVLNSLDGGGGAFGIASWNGDRQQRLKSWASNNGCDPRSLDCQGRFVVYELRTYFGGTWSTLTNSGASQSDRIGSLVKNFENPASRNVAPEIARATQNANRINGTQVDTVADATTGTAAGAASGGSGIGGTVANALGLGGAYSFAQALGDPNTWVRVGAVLVGILFLVGGLLILAGRSKTVQTVVATGTRAAEA